MGKRLDIRGCDLQTDQRVKLLALWQANQDGEDYPDVDGTEPRDWPVAAMVVVAVMWAVLVACLIQGGGF